MDKEKSVRLVSVNAFNLYGSSDPDQEERFRQVEEMLRRIDADVVAVQEIVAEPPASPRDPDKRILAERHVRALSDAIGLCCEIDGEVACALGGGIHHTALLWRDGIQPGPGTVTITPVAGAVRRFERDPDGMWHSLITAVFDLGGPRLRIGSVQLSPFDPGQGWGWRDAGQVMRAMNSDATPGLVGGDWNGPGSVVAYDPDPYVDVEWHPDHAYQMDENGDLDRRVAHRLEGPGRFRDCAHTAGARWTPTTGRFPADKHPPRRIDRWYATYHLPDAAVTGFHVVGAEIVGLCTDHDPVVVEINEAALTT